MAPSDGRQPSAATIEYLIQHVVLPPKLPQSGDYDASTHLECLLEVTIKALNDLKSHARQPGIVSFAIATIKNLVQSRDSHGDISEHNLRKILGTLVDGSNNGAIPLEVKAQNAGILITRSDDHILFEFFELSPTNDASMCPGRLVRVFPGLASKCSIIEMQEKGVLDMIAATVAKMSTQAARDMQPEVRKQGKMHGETRDTAHPGVVTDLLLNMTAAIGSTTNTIRISKNMREEVLWSNCKHPWRRSPLWLLVRISLHLVFGRNASDDMFKAFMLFMLSRILSMTKANWAELGSENLHFISAKILRRSRKLDILGQSDCLKPTWMDSISNELVSAHAITNNNWENVMNSKRADIDLSVLEGSKPEKSVDIQLKDLDAFVSNAVSRKPSLSSSEFKPTGHYTQFPPHALPSISSQPVGHGEYQYFMLAAIEAWVAQHLPCWIEANRSEQNTCKRIRVLMQDYFAIATKAYKGLPASNSMMYLVLLELWVASDSVVCSLYPLAKDYNPEICMETFQCLLLPLKSQMQRLNAAEQYVASRCQTQNNPSIFRDFGHPASFAVRFFDQSSELQDLLKQIERTAAEKREKKCKELATLKLQYSDLMKQHDEGECEYYEVVTNRYHNYTSTRHSKHCNRCYSKRQAEALDIHIYEWPVPTNKAAAKATIFELRIPGTFSEWRDASMFLITDVLKSNSLGATSPSHFYTLDKHRELLSMLDAGYATRRIVPLSSVKPHSATHRKQKKAIPNLDDEDICLENALQYGYYDSGRGLWSSRLESTDRTLKKCMHRMPAQSQTLERFLYKSPSQPDGVSSNAMIADLSECPVHFSIEEFKALCSVPFGTNLFYSNVLTQLAIPILDFAKAETHCLILQTISQAGPSNGSTERTSHHVLTSAAFGNTMLDQLEIALHRVEGNWESWRAAAAFVQLAIRLVNLTLSEDTRERGFRYLCSARQIFIKWFHRLKTRVSRSIDDEQRKELSFRTTEIALLCATTFDVEGECIDALLQQHGAISSLIQCAVSIQEHITESHPSPLYNTMIQSWRLTMHRIFPRLRRAILFNNSELHDAMLLCWSSYEPASQAKWTSMNKPFQHWLHIMSGNLPVHLNLLTAELLVSGLPMAQLPSAYISHPLYRPLFSSSSLEVAPTDEPGMVFSTKSTYHGYSLHFGMTGKDMHVVAMKDKEKLDLLPSRIFRDRLPFSFMTDFVHWYNYKTAEVQFRPRENPWQESVWRLKRSNSSWRLVNGSCVLVDTRSTFAVNMARLFQPLEDPQHIHIVLDVGSKLTEIRLPRLKLEFYTTSGDLDIKSRQWRGMVLDTRQQIGTLVGLSSKLVLRREDSRLVLIPEGHARYGRSLHEHHMLVSLEKQAEMKVHAYAIDDVLGRLLDTGDLQSKLFLCYLHALTSHCLPDALTGYTGTEAALIILKSAAVRSFPMLSQQNIDLLKLISELSPRREFYPPHERLMQQIEWDNNLPSLSQHSGLKYAVDQLLRQAKTMTVFHPADKCNTSTLEAALRDSSADDYLYQRDDIRSSMFQTLGFGTEQYSSGVDTKYNMRDREQNSIRGQRAFSVARMLLRNKFALITPIPTLKEHVIRAHFSAASVKGPGNSIIPSSLQYDSKWLEKPSGLLRELWCSLHQSLSHSTNNYNRYSMLAWLSTSAFGKSADMIAIQTIVAFHRVKGFADIEVPAHHNFELSHGSTWCDSGIQTAKSKKSFIDSSEARLPRRDSETERQHTDRIESMFETLQAAAMQDFIAELKKQWPCQQPFTPSSTNIDSYLDPSKSMESIRIKFDNWYRNKKLGEYLQKVSGLMASLPCVSVPTAQYPLTEAVKTLSTTKKDRFFDMDMFFAQAPPAKFQHGTSTLCEPTLQHSQLRLSSTNQAMRERLESLCHDLESYAMSKCEHAYIQSLRTSCASLEEQIADPRSVNIPSDWGCIKEIFQSYLIDCKNHFTDLNHALNHMMATDIRASDCIATKIKHSPRLCPTYWLGYLNLERHGALPKSWKTAFVAYGLAVTQLHRAQRLVMLADKSPADLAEETRQRGHCNWSPDEHPETLLLEAESGIMVRPVQATIAEQMIQPPNAKNTVMQLNMGEGKSSTICPIVAAALANKERLVRVIVAKPQSNQMLTMLISKLGNLINRRIYHMPFSRDLRLTANDADSIRELYEECMTNRGILLVQPEHLLSFKLMGLECLLSGQPDTARPLLAMQAWFDQVSRDIVDESDVNFSVTFELIYTMGSQRLIEFAPERWLVIQEVLGMIPEFARQVASASPSSMEVMYDIKGRYPRIRILQEEGAELLIGLLAKKIVRNGLSGLPIQNQPEELRDAVLTYITQPELSARDIAAVEDSSFWTTSTEHPLLLVRGLLACGVLRFTLGSKRYRVNYGFDPHRTPSTKLAIPFRAKDSPSPRSEFSHPDVIILLTQLCFYYGGLGDHELFASFVHLLKSDQATIQYNDWTRTAALGLPTAYHHISGVSIKDRVQCVQEVFPHLRYSRAAIDYYLKFLVFPKAMKEFPSKLSASGWDLGAIKTHPMTGFSGTNDTRYVMPLTIDHLDLPSQNHTNALVLGYLLQDETAVELLPTQHEAGTDAELILSAVNKMDPEVRVVLDVGATILEMDNEQVARSWLSMRKNDNTQAVVFFSGEQLSVLDATGRIEPFQVSPFANNLDQCLVYLDEAHTRGTDLKLPRSYRAAVALGANLTKDRLVQACMRLRKLGKGQSVVFTVPQEISMKIRKRTGKSTDDPIDVVDILSWSIGETWLDLSKSIPLWAVQGHRFEAHKHLLHGADTTMAQAKSFLEDEARSLDDRYKPKPSDKSSEAQMSGWDLENPNIQTIVARCKDFEATGFSSASLQEEQERELSPEIEEERQIERPAKMKPEDEQLHPDVVRLVQTGQLPDRSPALEPAFQALRSISAAQLCDLTQFPCELLVTKDFMKTVKIPPGSSKKQFISDPYQRQVQWILSVPGSSSTIQALVILSPFEANKLLPDVQKSSKVTLHLFSPCSNASLTPIDKLELFNVGRAFSADEVPRSLTTQLNLFAGSLYLRSYTEYVELCNFLGLLHDKVTPGQRVSAEGFITPPTGAWGLRESPVLFLRALLMKIRKEGEGIEKTIVGRILHGARLEESDFEDQD